MGILEIQVLESDRAAEQFARSHPEFCSNVHVGGGRVLYVQPDVASSLAEVAGLTPLMISLDYLLGLPFDSALGEERFEVTARSDWPGPREYGEEDAGRFDVIELRSGDMTFAALLPHDSPWPHVMVHRAAPRRHPFATEFTPALERAFLAALRDAVRSLHPAA